MSLRTTFSPVSTTGDNTTPFKNLTSIYTSTILSRGKSILQVNMVSILFCDHHLEEASLST